MYTEENEFDYNKYLDENNPDDENGNMNGPVFNKQLIIRILVVAIVLILLIFLVFKIRNVLVKKEAESKDKPDSALVFSNNMMMLKEVGENYFFDKGNYPKEVGTEVKVTVNDLIKAKFLTEIKDGEGKTCGYNTSYIRVKRNKNDYLMEINLSCSSLKDNLIYYYDLEFNCLTCNGENYVSSDNDNLENNSTTDNNTNNNNNNNNNNSDTQKPVQVCKDFGAWTTEKKTDANLEVETRTVVIGYKDNYQYSEWSAPSETPIAATSTLEVRTQEGTKSVPVLSGWSQKSKTKPLAKEGREIRSEEVEEAYYVNKTETETYTVDRKTWDNNAIRCVAKKLGEVTCTYAREVTKKVKKYRTVTYYQYQDTTTQLVDTTFYTSRTKTKLAPSYTGYILESNMPSGYQKVAGSERIEYRYREKCTAK